MGDTRLIRPFGGFLQEQRNGKLAAELAEALNSVVEAVLEHRKPGKLKLNIKISPTKMTGVLSVADELTVQLPIPDKGEAMFFADKDFNLVRNDPNQMEMEAVRELPQRDIRDLRRVGEEG
jgi:hypothetical protein